MKIYRLGTLCILVWIVTLLPLAHGAPVPLELGGITLGADITDYPHLEYSNFLKEVVVTDWAGFAKGMISYGVCGNPGMIIKTKFKFPDTSKKFYTAILDAYKKKFGDPGVWVGDAFGIQHIWKWSFVDKDTNRIEMVLQHNLKDPKLPIGTVVTLSYPDLIEKERKCFDAAHAKNRAISETLKRHNCCNPRHDQCLTASLQCTKTSRNLTWDIDITNSEKNHVGKGVQGTKSTGSIFHDFNNPVESLGNGIG